MSPNDIKHIVNCVVDYSWPWQWIATNGEWVTSEDQSLNNLLDEILTQPNGRSDNRQPPYVRLDPTHEWTWDVETRPYHEGWVKMSHGGWEPVYILANGVLNIDDTIDDVSNYDVVSIHPLNPTMEPPANWSPENKRILK